MPSPAPTVIPSRLYQARSYQFQASGFTGVEGSEIRVALSVENWPDVPLLATVRLTWVSGTNPDGSPKEDGAVYTIPGRPVDRSGQPLSEVTLGVQVPVTGVPATVKVDLTAAARTRITIQPV